MDEEFDWLRKAVRAFDIPELRRLAAGGADLNGQDAFGEPFLFHALFAASHYDEASKVDRRRYDVIASLIELGADPHQLGRDGGSILIGPIFSQDAAMVQLLLEYGVDPNRGCGEPWETVFELASFDYRYEAWINSGDSAPEFPKGINIDDEDDLLRYLDQDARTSGRLRPDILILLRKYGALSNHEITLKIGGNGSERIEWRDDRWCLQQTPIA